jgi:hypothetical protein
MVKRKHFVCKCGLNTSKTVPNYYSQLRRLGTALCTKCSIELNAKKTSDRLTLKYSTADKNKDLIDSPCEKCGKPRKILRRSVKNGYTLCKSCAAINNRTKNKDLYDNLAKQRRNNTEFGDKVSNGILSLPLDLRVYRSAQAHNKRWTDNKTERREAFIEQANQLHLCKYDYSQVNYINHLTKVNVICNLHGPFQMTPKHHVRDGYGCPRCSDLRAISKGHNEINQFIQNFQLLTDLNVKDIIVPYELDIVVRDRKLAIEYHGIYWHSYNHKETEKEKYAHYTKADLARQKGITLLQVFETEWILDRCKVESIIRSKLGFNTKIYARHCHVIQLSNNEYRPFMENYHLQGYKPATYKLGLLYNNELLEVIGISAHPNYQYELMRLATKSNYTIVGGLSKLLKYAQLDLEMNSLFTYADRRYSTGNAYIQCGFQSLGRTNPNYFYTKGHKDKPLLSRQMFQKHKLKNKLLTFDNDLTEYENMFSNGYRRIWDAGHERLLRKW